MGGEAEGMEGWKRREGGEREEGEWRYQRRETMGIEERRGRRRYECMRRGERDNKGVEEALKEKQKGGRDREGVTRMEGQGHEEIARAWKDGKCRRR